MSKQQAFASPIYNGARVNAYYIAELIGYIARSFATMRLCKPLARRLQVFVPLHMCDKALTVARVSINVDQPWLRERRKRCCVSASISHKIE